MTESLRKKGSGKPALASHRTPGTYMNLFIKPKRCICIKMILSLNDSVYMNYPLELTGPEHPEILWGHLMVTGIIPEPATLGLLSFLALVFLRRK